jgi:uncharacterized protein
VGGSSSPRIAAFDVVRAVVLLGVFTMNYIVEWNIDELSRVPWGSIEANPSLRRVMNPWTGPLATRFAATLTMLVGVGIVLLSARSVASGDASAVREDRWRLRRRGMVFVLAGIFFDVVWPGEILHFTGLYLIIAAWAIRWSASTLFSAAVGVAALTSLQRTLVFVAVGPEERYSWWGGALANRPRSLGTPRGFLSNVLSWGGHPVLPWLSFVFVGMAIAKLNLSSRRVRLIIIVVGMVGFVGGYVVGFIGQTLLPDKWDWVAATQPGGFGRVSPFGGGMPAYVLSTAGSSAVLLVSTYWLAERFAGALPIRVLARAGKVTFTIYVAHGVLPWALTSKQWVGQDFGLVGSIAIAAASWAVSMIVGALMHRRFGIGPLEWLLRQISGPSPLGRAPVSVAATVGTPGDYR